MTVIVPSLAEKDQLKQNVAIRQLAEGRSNGTGAFTLTANAGSTTVLAPNCAAGSVPLYVPTTANASIEIGNGTIRISSVANGSFVVTHANNAQTDRTFLFVCLG